MSVFGAVDTALPTGESDFTKKACADTGEIPSRLTSSGAAIQRVKITSVTIDNDGSWEHLITVL
jgi:hypothetical protein